jgi:GT2 family glycosyltransferase
MYCHVDVVIPVHNSVQWLTWCLEELFKFNSDKLNNVYVINDRSEYSQSYQIRKIITQHSNVELIENKSEMGGFGYACNLGAKQCNSEIILFLNTDCLLTEGVIDKLCAIFDSRPNVALACPISNNSPDLSFAMYPGRSYRDMAQYVVNATNKNENDFIVEACTVVGNCLMVQRKFFEDEGGFSAEWGVGYGEETDLHMKALSRGLIGVAHLGCYVYHFGGGTFNYQKGIEQHRSKNYDLFMSKWSEHYKALADRCSANHPIDIISSTLKQNLEGKSENIEIDALFYLPCIDQSIGGIHAVIAICNELVRMGIKATCAVIGTEAEKGLMGYKEPVLFNFLYYISDSVFLTDRIVLPKIVFSTIFTSTPIVSEYAVARKALAVQFIQGYEGYFDNGQRYAEATANYNLTEHLVTTSMWLFNMVNRHMKPSQYLQRLPLVINEDIFFSTDTYRDIDVCMVFRSSVDKGQWLLAEILDRLTSCNIDIAVLCSSPYHSLKEKYESKAEFIDLPLDQYSFAQLLRRVKVFVDASLHEGFGLMPLEASLCGCAIVTSDSGGVRDFVSKFGGDLVPGRADPDSHIEAIMRQLKHYKPRQHSLSLCVDTELSWYEYVRNLCKDQKPCILLQSDAPIADDDERNYHELKLHKTPCHQCIYTIILSIYRKFLPIIPQWLHLALKKIAGKGKL